MPYIEKCCQCPNLWFSAWERVVEACEDQLVGKLEQRVAHGVWVVKCWMPNTQSKNFTECDCSSLVTTLIPYRVVEEFALN